MEKVLYKFYAEWCGPCKMMAPVVAAVAAETGIEVKEIDIDKEPEMAKKYNISSVPTFVKVVDGEAVDSITGFVPEQKLKEFMI